MSKEAPGGDVSLAAAAADRMPGAVRRDGALLAGWVSSLGLVLLTVFAGRPVNDDYWAMDSLAEEGFWGSLAWYYADFQGNVASWFLILLHELAWLHGVGSHASVASIVACLVILSAACWGGLTFLGVRLLSGWRGAAGLTIVTAVAWLSLGSVISPNAMTFVFYVPSTIVHAWPWMLAIFALGLTFHDRAIRGGCGWTLLLGAVAGALGFVEGVLLVLATAAGWILGWRRRRLQCVPAAALGWSFGLAVAVTVQLVSPATWSRSSGMGTDAALKTNVQAVHRLLAQAEQVVGPGFAERTLGVVDVDVWARVLVPVAVLGDLTLRPGLLVVFVAAAYVARRGCVGNQLAPAQLRERLVLLAVVAVGGAVLYAASGALYAYSGRHVAGLALVVTVLCAGLGLCRADRRRGRRATYLRSAVGLVVAALLGVQQVSYGLNRAEAWDQAFRQNLELVREGRTGALVDVPLRAGLSRSGLRDHEGAVEYVLWLRRAYGVDLQ